MEHTFRGVEDGETVEEACIREVAEETGYEVKIVKALHTKKTIIKEYKVTTQYFLCEITGGDIQYKDPRRRNRRNFMDE